MIDLAQHDAGGYIPLRDISRRQEISAKYLEQIVVQLSRAGFVTSTRGAQGGWRLHRCDLYVTLEPCPMCAGAIINARIKTVYFGAFDPKAGSCGSMINLFSLPYNHQPELVSGVMEEQCADELRTFFRELRKKRKLIRKAQKSEEAAAESGEAQQDAFCEREK